MKKLFLSLSLVLLLTTFNNIATAAEMDFMELDETSSSGYNTLSGATINAKSALRVGNVGSGTDDFTTITAPYNEPRSGSTSSGVRAHKGTDFSSKTSSGTARKLFFVYGEGEVYQINTSLSSSGGYGRYVLAQHKHVQNGVNYYFQSFYAHLSSVNSNLKAGSSVGNTTEVGVSGGSGTAENTYPVHLHLEFRGASSTKSTTTRRYPTNFFYSHKGDYGLNTSFISRTAASSSSVSFRIVSVYSGSPRYTPENKVTLYYKPSNSTTWSTTTMTRASDQVTFTKSLTGLYGSATSLQYYVKAESNSYDGSTYYYSTRPYRYTDGTHPTDRPFTAYKNTSPTSINLDSTLVEQSEIYTVSKEEEFATIVDNFSNSSLIPDRINVNTYSDVLKVTLLDLVTKGTWKASTEKGDTLTFTIDHPNAAPRLKTGDVIVIGIDNSTKKVNLVNSDTIRVLDRSNNQ